MDANGVKVKRFELGVLDVKNLGSDYIFSNKKFRLIVFPRRLALEEWCDAQCMKIKKVRPRCQATTEYSLTYGIVASNYQPGVFESEIRMVFDDPKSDFGLAEPDLSFEKNIRGFYYRPKLEIRNDAASDKSFAKFLHSSQESFKLELVNVGNKGVEMGSWFKAAGEGAALVLKSEQCSGIFLAVNKSCVLYIDKVGTPNLIQKNPFVWYNSSRDQTSSIEISVKRWMADDPKIGTRNR